MDDMSTKTLGMLLDELVNTNIKCFFRQEQLADAHEADDAEATLLLSKQVMALNTRRNKLIQAIDAYVGVEDASVTDKTYSK